MGRRTNTAKWIEKNKRWQVNVQKDGRRRSFYSSKPGRTGQREANAKADAWLDDGIEGGSRKVSILFQSYLDDLKARTSETNWRPEESRWHTWIKPEIGHLKVDMLTDQHYQRIINNAFKAGLSKKTLKNLRAELFAFAKFCRKIKVSRFCPEDVTLPKGAPVGQRTILQPEDIITLFSVDTTLFRGKVVHDKFIHAYRFQAVTGLRPGELLGLQWQDIVGDTVNLRRSINVLGQETTGKNDNARRCFCLNNTSRAIIAAQRQQSDGPYVFPRVTEEGYRRYLYRYCAANHLPAVAPYEMRHTFVSIIQDLSEGEIRSLAGHSKNMDTLGVYSHKVSGRAEKIASNVEMIFYDILHPEEKSLEEKTGT